MIFAARKLLEKSRKYDDSFLHDLLISTRPMFQYLERPCGNYGVTLSLIKSFHDAMTAVVRVSNHTTDIIDVYKK